MDEKVQIACEACGCQEIYGFQTKIQEVDTQTLLKKWEKSHSQHVLVDPRRSVKYDSVKLHFLTRNLWPSLDGSSQKTTTVASEGAPSSTAL